MMTRDTLERMSGDELLAYVIRRMRGEEEDPPLTPHRMETPDDFLAVVHGQSMDLNFRSRLEQVTARALEYEAASLDPDDAPNQAAVQNLAELALRLRIKQALPALLGIAERGAFGGQREAIEERAERSVLFALAGLQEPKVLWDRWEALWELAEPKLWPIVTAGMRIANPYRATKLLPQIVGRAMHPKGFSLGHMLWVFAKTPQIDAEQIRIALTPLSAQQLEACRSGLHEVGATEKEIAAWIPEASSRMHPRWGTPPKPVPREPPRGQLAQTPRQGIPA